MGQLELMFHSSFVSATVGLWLGGEAANRRLPLSVPCDQISMEISLSEALTNQYLVNVGFRTTSQFESQ